MVFLSPEGIFFIRVWVGLVVVVVVGIVVGIAVGVVSRIGVELGLLFGLAAVVRVGFVSRVSSWWLRLWLGLSVELRFASGVSGCGPGWG